MLAVVWLCFRRGSRSGVEPWFAVKLLSLLCGLRVTTGSLAATTQV